MYFCAHLKPGKIIIFIELKFIIGIATCLCIHAGASFVLCGFDQNLKGIQNLN
jgi:hypothetical protein